MKWMNKTGEVVLLVPDVTIHCLWFENWQGTCQII